MTSEATPVVPGATPAAEEQTAPRTRSTQDRIMENKIIAAEQLAKILPTETDLAETLSEAGYGAQELVRFDVAAEGVERLRGLGLRRSRAEERDEKIPGQRKSRPEIFCQGARQRQGGVYERPDRP